MNLRAICLIFTVSVAGCEKKSPELCDSLPIKDEYVVYFSDIHIRGECYRGKKLFVYGYLRDFQLTDSALSLYPSLAAAKFGDQEGDILVLTNRSDHQRLSEKLSDGAVAYVGFKASFEDRQMIEANGEIREIENYP